MFNDRDSCLLIMWLYLACQPNPPFISRPPPLLALATQALQLLLLPLVVRLLLKVGKMLKCKSICSCHVPFITKCTSGSLDTFDDIRALLLDVFPLEMARYALVRTKAAYKDGYQAYIRFVVVEHMKHFFRQEANARVATTPFSYAHGGRIYRLHLNSIPQAVEPTLNFKGHKNASSPCRLAHMVLVAIQRKLDSHAILPSLSAQTVSDLNSERDWLTSFLQPSLITLPPTTSGEAAAVGMTIIGLKRAIAHASTVAGYTSSGRNG